MNVRSGNDTEPLIQPQGKEVAGSGSGSRQGIVPPIGAHADKPTSKYSVRGSRCNSRERPM